MTDTDTAVVLHESAGVELGMLRVERPADLIAGASEIATALAKVIADKKLAVKISGRAYVKCEGWTTLGAMLGVTPHEVSVVEEPEGVFTATVELRRLSDGQAVGRASMECGSPDELDRNGRPSWANRPRYARRSMALTRATAKAMRLAFSWVMVLAGYEATPFEEMPTDDSPKRAAPPVEAPTDDEWEELRILLDNAYLDDLERKWIERVLTARDLSSPQLRERLATLKRNVERRLKKGTPVGA